MILLILSSSGLDVFPAYPSLLPNSRKRGPNGLAINNGEQVKLPIPTSLSLQSILRPHNHLGKSTDTLPYLRGIR